LAKPFLITSLPRSRTAWWSVAASTPVSRCVHEPLKNTESFDELVDCWDGDKEFAGISDSGLVPQLGRILAAVEPRTLLIRRDPKQVIASFMNYMSAHTVDLIALRNYVTASNAELDKWAKHPLVRSVNYDDLCDVEFVETCFEWLMPGQFDHFNFELMDMNIQVDKGFAATSILAPHSRWFLAA
jgi:hypothetical protein